MMMPCRSASSLWHEATGTLQLLLARAIEEVDLYYLLEVLTDTHVAMRGIATTILVPRRGAELTRIVNSLSCPTCRERPIESQYVFCTLSHRLGRADLEKQSGQMR
jgi:hypothetical protein